MVRDEFFYVYGFTWAQFPRRRRVFRTHWRFSSRPFARETDAADTYERRKTRLGRMATSAATTRFWWFRRQFAWGLWWLAGFAWPPLTLAVSSDRDLPLLATSDNPLLSQWCFPSFTTP